MHPCPHQLCLSPHFQHVRQRVELLLFVLSAVRITKVQQALVVLLQELVELRVFVLQPRELVLMLRCTTFTPAEKAGVIKSNGQG